MERLVLAVILILSAVILQFWPFDIVEKPAIADTTFGTGMNVLTFCSGLLLVLRNVKERKKQKKLSSKGRSVD